MTQRPGTSSKASNRDDESEKPTLPAFKAARVTMSDLERNEAEAARAASPSKTPLPEGYSSSPELQAWERPAVFGDGRTDVGRMRHHNEDHILVRNDLGLYVVCDGMGGHNAGEVASALAVASIRNYFEATEHDSIEDGGEDPLFGARRLGSSIHKSNGDVFEISTTHPQHHGMGCTVVAAHVSAAGDAIHIVHLGDSRCYRLRAGKLEALTRDHSLINDLLQLKPELSLDDVAHLPKNIVTRALGIESTVAFDVRTEELLAGDMFLLCSDGLSGMLDDEVILSSFELTSDPGELSALLVEMANDAGGHDNISVVVLKVLG